MIKHSTRNIDKMIAREWAKQPQNYSEASERADRITRLQELREQSL